MYISHTFSVNDTLDPVNNFGTNQNKVKLYEINKYINIKLYKIFVINTLAFVLSDTVLLTNDSSCKGVIIRLAFNC